jgi:short-subunit dehydrogenase
MHVVVTGASSGIGCDLAKAFDRPGNTLSLVARRRALLEELCGEIRAPAHVIAADLTDSRDPLGWLRAAEAEAGPIDVLVNNAGISYVEPVLGIDDARLKSLFQVNLHTPLAAIHHVLPGMLERGRGTIVNIASVAAFTNVPYFCHYHATKAALASFSECLRMELKKSGVDVVSVYPGPIHTPMADRNFEQFKQSAKARLAPTGDSRTLARLVLRAIDKKHARVIYPAFYRIAWWFPTFARFVSERALPEVKGTITPALGGDLENRRPAAE